jgi:hypothetical protein
MRLVVLLLLATLAACQEPVVQREAARPPVAEPRILIVGLST